MTDEINMSRRLDIAWDSERHELIILGRRFKPADPDADEQDRADDAREVFYALTDMNRLVSEVEELVDQLRAVAGHHMIAPLREQLRKTTEQRDEALAEAEQLRERLKAIANAFQIFALQGMNDAERAAATPFLAMLSNLVSGAGEL